MNLFIIILYEIFWSAVCPLATTMLDEIYLYITVQKF